MSVHLQRAIESLKKQLLSLCGLVEDQVEMAVRALLERNETLAAEVELADREIDEREVYVEEECLKVLALHQPVATDLRLVVAALKINNDLERIGDLAVNIRARPFRPATTCLRRFPSTSAGCGKRLRQCSATVWTLWSAWTPSSPIRSAPATMKSIR